MDFYINTLMLMLMFQRIN